MECASVVSLGQSRTDSLLCRTKLRFFLYCFTIRNRVASVNENVNHRPTRDFESKFWDKIGPRAPERPKEHICGLTTSTSRLFSRARAISPLSPLICPLFSRGSPLNRVNRSDLIGSFIRVCVCALRVFTRKKGGELKDLPRVQMLVLATCKSHNPP